MHTLPASSHPYYCPSCQAEVARDAELCQSCGADFGARAAWRPQSKHELENPPATGTDALIASLGVALLVATVFPVGSYLVSVLTGGMYGPVFKPHAPALFILTTYVSNYLPFFLMAYWFIKRFGVVAQAPKKYRSTSLFGAGSALILVVASARVLAATVPGGGAGFAVASLAPLIVLPALVILGVSVIRLAIGWGRSGA